MKLLTLADCTKNLKALAENQINLTISLAYHTAVHGNAKAFKGLERSVVNRLDSLYRQFIAVKWDKEANEWRYNSAKSKKLMESFGLEFQKSTFEEFIAAVKGSLDAKEVKALEEAQAEAALDPVARKEKELNDAKERVQKYIEKQAQTLTKTQMLDIIAKVYDAKLATAA